MFMMSDRNVTKYCKRFLALCIVTGLLFTTTGCSVFGPKQKPYKTYKPSVSETPVASEQPVVNLSEEQAGEFARRYLAKMTTEQNMRALLKRIIILWNAKQHHFLPMQMSNGMYIKQLMV